LFQQNLVRDDSQSIATSCYTKFEDNFGWCATCNINSTKPLEPNYCSYEDAEEDGDGSKKKTKAIFQSIYVLLKSIYVLLKSISGLFLVLYCLSLVQICLFLVFFFAFFCSSLELLSSSCFLANFFPFFFYFSSC
jgi:hypothetical protein